MPTLQSYGNFLFPEVVEVIVAINPRDSTMATFTGFLSSRVAPEADNDNA